MPRKPPPLTEAVANAVDLMLHYGYSETAQELRGAFNTTMASGKTLMEAEGYVAVSPEEMAAWRTLEEASREASHTCMLPKPQDGDLDEALEALEAVTTKEDEG